MNKFKEIDEKLNEIEKKLHNIDDKINTIICKLDNNVIPNTNDMKRHITFIENVYNYVKSPLGFLCNRIYYLIGKNKYDLIDYKSTSILYLN
tara:strand:+ start:356 stop:631 length:276 start_codon:yes stop_codon:yes gene_type:complete